MLTCCVLGETASKSNPPYDEIQCQPRSDAQTSTSHPSLVALMPPIVLTCEPYGKCLLAAGHSDSGTIMSQSLGRGPTPHINFAAPPTTHALCSFVNTRTSVGISRSDSYRNAGIEPSDATDGPATSCVMVSPPVAAVDLPRSHFPITLRSVSASRLRSPSSCSSLSRSTEFCPRSRHISSTSGSAPVAQCSSHADPKNDAGMSTARENHAYQGISLGIFRITYGMV